MDPSMDSTSPAEKEVIPPFAPQIEEAARSLGHFNEQALAFIRERPLACLVAAISIGFVVGKIAARN